MEKENSIITMNNDSNMMEYEIEDIKKKIYTIRGKQVMLDRDLAKLYNCKNGTKTLNQAVRRNIERFPERFMFQITKEEYKFCGPKLGPQNSVAKIRSLPYAFTEQGIAMLATVIKTEIAVEISIKIMDAFVEMKRLLINNQFIIERINTIEINQLEHNKKTTKMLSEHEKKFDMIFKEFEKDNYKNSLQRIFYEGQIWDSYNLIVNIIKRAEGKILIIDNYIDDSILEMLSKKKKGVEVVILTSNNSNILKLDIQKFNKEYPILKVSKTEKFHDRFIIIDNKELYHCGASLKDLGKKCFAISKIEDRGILNSISQKIQ